MTRAAIVLWIFFAPTAFASAAFDPAGLNAQLADLGRVFTRETSFDRRDDALDLAKSLIGELRQVAELDSPVESRLIVRHAKSTAAVSYAWIRLLATPVGSDGDPAERVVHALDHAYRSAVGTGQLNRRQRALFLRTLTAQVSSLHRTTTGLSWVLKSLSLTANRVVRKRLDATEDPALLKRIVSGILATSCVGRLAGNAAES